MSGPLESNENFTETLTGRHHIDAPHIPWHALRVSTALQCDDGLDAQALLNFVISPEIFGSDRRVLSWLDPDRTGYAYDECTALYGRLYTWLGRAQDAIAMSNVLERQLSEQGWLGRNDIGYAFDTALGIDAVREPSLPLNQVIHWLTSGVACSRVTRPGWWSQSYGAHLLKCLPPLARHGRRTYAIAIADDIIEKCYDGGRFRIHADSQATYIHSHCYAMEGMLGLQAHPDVLLSAADWLSAQMLPSGALPAWVGAQNERYPSDVVAQAVRLFSAVDPSRYSTEIEKGLQRLAELQDPSTGGIRYTLSSRHVNTWASAFALQAVYWAARPPVKSELQWLV